MEYAKTRKILCALCAALLTLFCAAGLTGCKDAPSGLGNGGGNGGETISEFAEYEDVVLTVAETSLQNLASERASSRLAARSLRFDKADKGEIWEIIDAASGRVPDDVTYVMQDILEQSFYLPLICGEVVTEMKGSEKFYGVSCRMPFAEQSTMTESDGTHYINYVYTPAEGVFGVETFIVMDIDYRSETDFSFYWLQFAIDGTGVFFDYGDSDGDFIVVNGDSREIRYRRDGADYLVSDTTAVASVMALLEDDYASVDLQKIRAVGANNDYVITQDEFTAASEKYFGDTGPSQDPSIDA